MKRVAYISFMDFLFKLKGVLMTYEFKHIHTYIRLNASMSVVMSIRGGSDTFTVIVA